MVVRGISYYGLTVLILLDWIMNKKKNKKRISKLENFNKKRESYTKFLVEKRETKKK